MNTATLEARFIAPSDTTIGHLTVRHNGPPESMNPTALRLRVERLLGGVDLHPAGLASGAVLIVRNMRGLVPLQVSTLSRSSQKALEDHLRDQMANLCSMAVRPAFGRIPSDANSILFNDPGEMLTCLTHDLLTGRAWQRWYWQQLLRSTPQTPASALTAMWREHAVFVPIVLASLRLEEVRIAIALLSPGEVSQITYALHSSFDLPSTVLAIMSMTESVQLSKVSPDIALDTEAANQQSSSTADRSSVDGEPAREQLSLSPFVPPWQRWFPNDTFLPPLTPQAGYLLGLGLTLYHAPALARSTRFATRAATWLHTQRNMQSPRFKSYQSLQGRETAQASEVQKEFPSPATSQHPQDSSSALSIPSAAEIYAPTVSQHAHIADPAIESAGSTEQPFQSESLSSQTLVELEPMPLQTLDGAPSPPALSQVDMPDTPGEVFMFGTPHPLPSEGVLTELGGILYLINLLNWLNLLAAVGEDEESMLAEHLSGWAAIELLARALLGTMHDRFVNDSIWSVLALLDQREPGTPIGTAMFQQPAFRLPAQWLRRYGPAEPEWNMATDAFRLFLLDATAGYLVADVPLLERSPGEVLFTEVEAYREQGVDTRITHVASVDLPLTDLSGHASAISPDLVWWLERASGFLRHLLARALGEPTMNADQLAEMLLCAQGRLLAGRTHIDLHMSLEQIGLPIRKAGLDRDPGWVPDLGRIILFHFD